MKNNPDRFLFSISGAIMQHLKPYGSSFSSNNKVNNSVGLVCSSKSARGEWEDNRCKQNKISSTGQVANNRAMANSGGYGFSLPWYRLVY